MEYYSNSIRNRNIKKGLLALVILLLNLFFAIVCFACDIPAPGDELFYIAPKSEIQIDGNLEEWAELSPVLLNQKQQVYYPKNDWKGETDCSIQFWWAWNDSGIVIAARTFDDSVSFPFSESRSWANDCIQFAIDVDDDNAQDYFKHDDHEFVLTMVNNQPIVYEYTFVDYRTAGVRPYPCQISVKKDTICYEALIPWSAIGVSGAMEGKHVGASLIVFDNDGDDFRGYLQWTAGIANRKYTLPFANILLFNKELPRIQAIITRPFISADDSLSFWVYSKYRRQYAQYQLDENDEPLIRNKFSVPPRKWRKISIPKRYLKWGWLKLEISSVSTKCDFNIAVWSKQRITEQIAYLAKQINVLKTLKEIDPSSPLLIKYWVDWLQSHFSTAVSNFDFFSVMNQGKKWIDQVPNFYMNKQVFYNQESRLVENTFFSDREEMIQRYLAYLPTTFDEQKSYPLCIFLPDNDKDEEDNAKLTGQILTKLNIPLIGLFPQDYSTVRPTYFFSTMIFDLINDVKKKYKININQVYLIGEGASSQEALLLAQQEPDRFAAVTFINAKIDPDFDFANFKYTSCYIMTNSKISDNSYRVFENMKSSQVNAEISVLSSADMRNHDIIYSEQFFKWLLKQQQNPYPTKVVLHVHRLHPSTAFAFEILGHENYDIAGYFEALVDTNRITISVGNISAFSINLNKLNPNTRYPLGFIVNGGTLHTLDEKSSSHVVFYKIRDNWKIRTEESNQLYKFHNNRGPISEIFMKKLKFIYSTSHKDKRFNELTKELALETSQRGASKFLKHFVIADTNVNEHKINSNLIVFGNVESNHLLAKLGNKLPITNTTEGLKFGRSDYTSEGCAAIYIYPNPLNTNYMILVAIANDFQGLENIKKFWNIRYDNHFLLFDYVFFRNPVANTEFSEILDYGYFDVEWKVPWYRPKFRKGPKVWYANVLVGFDANQLTFNNNWQGGGKGNFTWKVYSQFEIEKRMKLYKWKTKLYSAFGQISVQENAEWRSPEKSNDVIEFESIVRFTLKKFIDPYVSITSSSQFQEGLNPNTKKIVSKFANPLQLSQGAGISKNIFKHKRFNLITRLGSSAKEVIATDQNFRELWTGDENQWIKIDGGIEWYLESKSKFYNSINWTHKVKFFQAFISTISKEKDPNRDWRKTDVMWEHMFKIHFNKFIQFNILTKFIYDKDTSEGGQFLENVAFGLTYELKEIGIY